MIEPERIESGRQYQLTGHGRAGLILLSAATDNLDLVGVDGRVLHLKGDVLDEEGPDLVTEAVGIKMSLCSGLVCILIKMLVDCA